MDSLCRLLNRFLIKMNCDPCHKRKGEKSLGERVFKGEIVLVMPPESSEEDIIDRLNYLDIDHKSINSGNIERCPCNDRVVLVGGITKGGVLVGDPLNKRGGGSSGGTDLNYFTFLPPSSESAAGKHLDSCKDGKERYEDKTEPLPDAIPVAILDSPVDTSVIARYFEIAKMDIRNIRIENVSCGDEGDINRNHGTAVAIRLIERLIKKGLKKNVHIKVYNIIDARNIDEHKRYIISQFKVLCALLEAVEDKNQFINMSFSFPGEMPLIEDILNSSYYAGIVKGITCAAGNDFKDISKKGSHMNYPSAYAREGYGHIYEVVGTMLKSDDDILWEYSSSGTHGGSNFLSDDLGLKIYSSDALLDLSDPSQGGTSFASPRILADLIVGEPFEHKTLTIPLGSKMNCLHAK